MELSKVDKDSILNPIIDEIGVIPPSEKERIVFQISCQLDRIINNKFSDLVFTLSESLKALSSNVDTILVSQKQSSDLLLRVASLEKRFNEEVSNISRNLEEIKKIRSTPVIVKEEVVVKESTLVIDPRKELEEKKFSELVKIAKEKKLDITARMKKEDIITLIIEGGN